MSTIYEARAVTRSFDVAGERLDILKGVDLAVESGELLAVMGMSGSGKTTLLHILGLLDRPTSGEVLLDGVDLARAPDVRRNAVRASEIAFVFQFYYLLPEFTALENVMFPALVASGTGLAHRAPEGRAAREARARELLDRVGLSSRLRHKPDQLSGGERQRVAIARALMNRPRIVFCDEPTGNLDPRTASGVHALFRELNRDMGQTFVVVTHDIRMADAASRRVHLEDGRTVAAPSEASA